MNIAFVAAALLLTWLLISWNLRRTFDDVGRAVIEDDLGEYSVLYHRSGAEAVRDLFTAGNHADDQIVRIVGPSGDVKLDVLPTARPSLTWPPLREGQHNHLPPGETRWHRETLPSGITLTLGKLGLNDGAQLWFGRTDAQDREAISHVHHLILLAMCITAGFAILPVMWFVNSVLRPVRELIRSANLLASNAPLDHRLGTTGAIPELNEFATAFNHSLDRVQALTEELEAANDQLAHELRTPLARVRLHVESVLTQCSTPATGESAARAVEEIDRAADLIQAILSIRSGDSRSMRLLLSMVSLRELLAATCELYSPAADEKDLELSLLFNGNDLLILLDRQRLQQALCNLLDNALNYTPPGGRVEIELETCKDHATVYVRDSGPGLDESEMQRIWRRFIRGSAASANIPGIGLGLSLVKAVVHAHRGEVGARNLADGGAEFWIRLPTGLPGAA